MIKYFIRTTGQRKLNSSYNQVEYSLLVDKEHKPIESFIRQLIEISNYDAVLLEDDVRLCRNFKEEIEKVISEHPNDIINFFYAPKKWFTSYYTTDFAYNQCTYYPKGKAKILAETIEEIYKTKKVNGYDVLEMFALQKLGWTNYVYRPCLVQHIDRHSIIMGTDMIRRVTPFFKDYLDELHIDYMDTKAIYDSYDILMEMVKKDVG